MMAGRVYCYYTLLNDNDLLNSSHDLSVDLRSSKNRQESLA